MKEDTITLPYKVILKRLWGESYFGNIGIKKFREILTVTFRMGRDNWKKIYEEMKYLNYIKYLGSKRAGLMINIPLKDLV